MPVRHKTLILLSEVKSQNRLIKKSVDDIVKWLYEITYGEVQLLVEYYDCGDPVYTVSATGAGGTEYANFGTVIADPNGIINTGEWAEVKLGEEFDTIALFYNPDKVVGQRPKNPAHTPIYREGFTTFQVIVWPEQQRFALAETFVHELLHAWYYLINQRKKKKVFEDDVHTHSGYQDPRPEANFSDIIYKMQPYWHLLETKFMSDYKKTNRNIKDLDPQFQVLVNQFIPQLQFGNWKGFITEGFRSCERQNYLYQLGRSLPGAVVTNAKCGQSDHNFGKAIDIAFKNNNGAVSYETYLFDEASEIAKELGIKWGGDWWSFKDRPHFYMDEFPYDNSFIEKWKGYIILDVNDKGKLWYVHPTKGVRYHLDFSNLIDAQKQARKYAYGFKHSNVIRIPEAGELMSNFDQSFIDKWSGYIILDVDDFGKLWYVSPKERRRYHLDFSNLKSAQEQAKKYAYGFRHADVVKIPIG